MDEVKVKSARVAEQMTLQVHARGLHGTYEIMATPREDSRGYFMRTWDDQIARAAGLACHWVQENQSFSRHKGTIRGLHFQRPPHAETKLVRALHGAVLDVFVDLRRDSATYGQWDAVELSADNHVMIYLPAGFAHGYCTLTDDVLLIYKVDAPYAPAAEGGIRWDDPSLGIDWPVRCPVLSAKDLALPSLEEFKTPF
jgi:dTDP-4-dehydrorhamnose 3,5-epimerase